MQKLGGFWLTDHLQDRQGTVNRRSVTVSEQMIARSLRDLLFYKLLHQNRLSLFQILQYICTSRPIT